MTCTHDSILHQWCVFFTKILFPPSLYMLRNVKMHILFSFWQISTNFAECYLFVWSFSIYLFPKLYFSRALISAYLFHGQINKYMVIVVACLCGKVSSWSHIFGFVIVVKLWFDCGLVNMNLNSLQLLVIVVKQWIQCATIGHVCQKFELTATVGHCGQTMNSMQLLVTVVKSLNSLQLLAIVVKLWIQCLYWSLWSKVWAHCIFWSLWSNYE